MAGNMNDSGCLEIQEVCIFWNPEMGCFQLDNNFGNTKFFKQPDPKVTHQLTQVGDRCLLQTFVNKVLCDTTDMTPILAKLVLNPLVGFNPLNCNLTIGIGEFSNSVSLLPLLQQFKVVYDSASHSMQCVLKGQPFGEPQYINCGDFDITIDTEEGICSLKYTNEKGEVKSRPLPAANFIHDTEACTLTIIDPLKGTQLIIPTGVAANEVKIDLDDNCDLVLCYKGKECTVQLPNFVTDVIVDQAECTLKISKWKGDPIIQNYLDVITLTKDSATGAAVLSVKGVTCPILPPTDPDGYSELGLVQGDGTDGSGNVIVDFNNDPIPPGTQVINYFAADGTYVNSKDCTELFSSVTSDDGSVSITPTTAADGTPRFDLSVEAPPLLAKDCAGDLIDETYTPLTVEQGHAHNNFSNVAGLGADDSCKPPPPSCPTIIGQRVFTQDDYGTIDWMWNGTDWVDVNFSPWHDTVPYQGGFSATASESNGQLAAAAASDIVLGKIGRTIENTGCYCLEYCARVYTSINWNLWSNDNQFVIKLQDTANDTASTWVGDPESIIDTTQWDGELVRQYDLKARLVTESCGTIPPGGTLVLEHEVVLSSNQYTPNPNGLDQRVTASGVGGRVQLTRRPC